MSSSFVKDPRAIAKPGDIVKVKVVEVDVARKRIALTMRLDEAVRPKAQEPRQERPRPGPATPKPVAPPPVGGGAMAEALRLAALKKR